MAGDQAELSQLLEQLGLDDAPLALGEARLALHQEVHRALAKHGDLEAGLDLLSGVASIGTTHVELDADAPRAELAQDGPRLAELEGVLRRLGPWRKGPFVVRRPGAGELFIDSEWRSDHKWRRILQLGASFRGQRVLDVGTGNGYFLLRLLGAGASQATGLEPSLRSVLQFLALRRLFPLPGCALIPLRLEALPRMEAPPRLEAPPPHGVRYDTVMSMGVLYHGRQPLDHLARLRQLLEPGGDLILETIVVPGPQELRIAPGERYAGMRNVYVLPTRDTVLSWLTRADFEIVHVGEAIVTTSAEQRRTSWAEAPSLEDVLETADVAADDPLRRTREGHPRPARLAVWARRPRTLA